jgi:hypothetical protein
VPADEEGDVEEDDQPEVDLKGAIAPLVTKEPLSRQRPRPAAAEGEEVQGAFSDAPVAAPGREFVETIDDEGDDAEEAVDEDDQMVTSLGVDGAGDDGILTRCIFLLERCCVQQIL